MRSNLLSERKIPRFFPVHANTDRPFSRALNIFTGCPTIKTVPISVSLPIYHIPAIDFNRAIKFDDFPCRLRWLRRAFGGAHARARERLLPIGGGRFRGMGGDGKSRRGAFAAGFFDRASARLPRRGFGFDGARARANNRRGKTSFCGKPAFRFPTDCAHLSG